MTKQHRLTLFVFGILLLPVVGYGISYGLALAFPVSGEVMAIQAVFVVLMVVGLLAVPYGMLKLVAHTAHEINPKEKELRLKDIPKDKDQLDHSRS